MKTWIAVGVGSVVVVSACANGGLPTSDAGKGNDTGVVGKDSGNPGNDTGTTEDTGSGKDVVVDTCQKAPPSNVCGVFPQCDCPAQQTCEVNQTALDGSSSCIAAGSKTTGQSCTATMNECAPGLTCIWGKCHPYCGTQGSLCTDPLTNSCINLTDNSQKPIPNLLVCHINCALQDPNTCGGGSEGCVYFAQDQVDCYPVGTATTCSATTSCKPGEVCVFDGVSTYTCSPWCRIGMSDCSVGVCNAFGTPPTVNSQQYGYCK